MSFEDRQDLLGHRSGRITTHYSTAELHKLIEAANKVCRGNEKGLTLTVLKRTVSADLRKNFAVVVPIKKAVDGRVVTA